jgi:hypothetical protein
MGKNFLEILIDAAGENLAKLNPLINKEAETLEKEELTKNLKNKIDEDVRIKILKGASFIVDGEGIILVEEGKKIIWSFNTVPKIQETRQAKAIKNAYVSSSVILNKNATPSTDNISTIENLQKQIKCIECSIKKLELNLKLTNEDGIKDEEFLTLLTEISGLCGTETGEDDCKTNLQEFVDEVILKRDMNSIAGLIKMASFMCPILAFANKNLFSNLTATGEIAQQKDIEENTVGICSKIIGYITRSGNEGVLTFDDTASELDFIDKAHDMGVTEAIVSFVGIGGANVGLEKKIAGSIRSVVRGTVKNTIETVLKTATFYQKFICIVFITLLSTHIYLTLCKNGGNPTDAEEYYKSSIEFLYNNMTNESMKIGFGNETITTGGKRASKSRRAANAAKPRATRAAKAVSKAIAKAVAKPKTPTAKPTKPTKQPIKPTAKPTDAKAAPKKKKN